MKKSFAVIPFLLLAFSTVQGGDLHLVSSVRYEDLRGRLKNLSPNHDYGDRRVEIWADVEGECFEGRESVIEAFGGWLDSADLPGFPTEVEFRCKPWTNGRSVVAITQYDSRQRPPHHLWVYSASFDGARLSEMLADADIGSALVVGFRLEFGFARGRVTAVLACREMPERSDGQVGYPEWLSTSVFVLGDALRRVDLDVLAAYRIDEGESTYFVLLTRGHLNGAATWNIQTVGSSIEQLEMVKLKTPLAEMTNTGQTERTLEALAPVLVRIAEVTSSANAVSLFESSIVTSHLRAYQRLGAGLND